MAYLFTIIAKKARSSGFLMFSGDIERDKWNKSGQTVIYQKGD